MKHSQDPATEGGRHFDIVIRGDLGIGLARELETLNFEWLVQLRENRC